MNAEEGNSIIEKPELVNAKPGILRTLLSIALYIVLYFVVFRLKLSWILLLVFVILLHELGHYIAMKRFGYSGVRMLFVPFLGAFVSGEQQRSVPLHRVIILLAGPLPGIVIGIGLYFWYQQSYDRFYFDASLLFILLNAFNLLPVSPLDGGQLLETLFLESNTRVQSFFIVLSCILLVYISVITRNYFLLFIVWLLIMRFRHLSRIRRLRKVLSEEGLSYEQSFANLSDEEYTRLRSVLIRNQRSLRQIDPLAVDEDEELVVEEIRQVLQPPAERELSVAAKILVCLIWLVFLLIPLLLLLRQQLF